MRFISTFCCKRILSFWTFQLGSLDFKSLFWCKVIREFLYISRENAAFFRDDLDDFKCTLGKSGLFGGGLAIHERYIQSSLH